jgi:CRISPR-associated protein Csb2
MTHLLLTVRFLDDRYHGLLDRGGPVEWPPSPFRLFQALVAGVARRGELVVGADEPANTNFTPIGQSLGWLQKHSVKHPPIIIAPKHKVGQAITRFVPNNDGDKKFDRQERLTAKPTIPTLFLLEPDQKPEVHYVWDISGKTDCPASDIEKAARSLTTLGWGIDMAFADARLATHEELQQLKGVRWYPKPGGGSFEETLRVPTLYYDEKDEIGECTLCDLRHCHSTAMNRIEHGKPLKTVDKPKVFDRVLYTSVERPVGRSFRVFRIECDDEERRFTYPQSKLIHIAGIVKHLAIELMRDNPPRDLRMRSKDEWLRAYVSGHQSNEDKEVGVEHTQFSYVPLQTVNPHNDLADPGVRRVMIVAPLGDDAWLDHLAQRLDGMELRPLPNTRLPTGTRLELIPDNKKDGVRDAYCKPACVWASTTPVILPGHDDHKPEKTRKLIEKALAQSGVEQPCEFEWSAFSQFRKMLPAHKYRKDPSDPSRNILINYVRPDHLLEQSAVHLTMRFTNSIAVPGPITIGAGRHCGFGLMAAIDD